MRAHERFGRGLAFFGFPLMATLGGFLGLAFGRYGVSADVSRRIGALLGLAAARTTPTSRGSAS